MSDDEQLKKRCESMKRKRVLIIYRDERKFKGFFLFELGDGKRLEQARSR